MRKIANRLARRPIKAAWAEFEHRLPIEQKINEDFDRRHGTDTAAEIALVEAGVSPDDAVRGHSVYRPVWEGLFHDALASLGISFEGFIFVDIGSGKGKALMMAADYPFARIIGVEYSPDLHACALRNLAVYRSSTQRCFNLESVHANALEYLLPSGPIVCLVFNALEANVMRLFIKHVEGDLALREAPAYLLYTNMRHVAEIGDGLDGIRKLHRLMKTRKLIAYGNEAALR